MILKSELLIRSMTPDRAAEVLNIHDAVANYQSQNERHAMGQQFAERIWPLLQRYVADEDSVQQEEILDVCNQEKEVFRESAWFFCEVAFHTTFDCVSKEAREKRLYKAWRFWELAVYLNEHLDVIDSKLLDWAYFTWNSEFAATLALNEDGINTLIDGIDADKIKDSRHNRDYFGYDGDLLELPDWLVYLAIYLEDRQRYDKINDILERLKYIPLQNAFACRLKYPESLVKILKLKGSVTQEFGVVLLSRWYRNMVQEGATLRGYYRLDKIHLLSTEGRKAFETWETTIKDTLWDTIVFFFEHLGRGLFERWYYTVCHYHGLPNTDVDESEAEIRQIINGVLADTFKEGDEMTDFANAEYLVFLGNQCEKLKGNALAEALWEGYNNFLHSNELYKLPEFGDDLMELFRGYSLPIRMRKSHIADYRSLLAQYLTHHEGLGCKIKDDYNNKVAREVFVMSALILMTEDDDLIEGERKLIFANVLDMVFRQISSCWMEHLQERYVDVLKVCYAMTCQIWVKEREAFELRLVQSPINLYWVVTVLSVGDGKMFADTSRLLHQRWVNEHVVMYIRAQQTHRMNRYNALKMWLGKIGNTEV